MKREMLRLTSTSHDDSVPLLICNGENRCSLYCRPLSRRAVAGCGLRCRPQMAVSVMSIMSPLFRSKCEVFSKGGSDGIEEAIYLVGFAG
jgi:hypothetical protein